MADEETVWGSPTDAGPLSGIRVADFGQYIAGPLAATILADQGAEVIRIERPGGPSWKSEANAALLRGRRTVQLDLKRPVDVARARRLLAGADVLIENFRPGAMDRLGLGYAEVASWNPALVYCSIPGFGHDDPRAAIPAWEGVAMAAGAGYASPLAGMWADQPAPEGSEPVYSPIALASLFAAVHAGIGVAAALVARERDGGGQRVEVPLSDALLEGVGSRGLAFERNPPRGMANLGSGIYRGSDGRPLTFLANWHHHLTRMLEAADRTDWIEEGVADYDRLWSDPAAGEELQRRLIELFRTRPAVEWEEVGRRHGASLGAIRTTREWLEQPYPLESGALVRVTDPELGDVVVPGRGVTMAGIDLPAVGPRASSGSATDIAAEQLDLLPEPVRMPPAPAGDRRPPLDGVRVLEMARVVAAPTVGRILAQLGADVIKIDRDPSLSRALMKEPMQHHQLNRGKRTRTVDVKSPEGRRERDAILSTCDVLVQNFTLGVGDRIGLSDAETARLRPDLVHVYLNAFGSRGSWSSSRGFAEIANVCTGLTDFTRHGEFPPSGSSPIIDLPRWFFTDTVAGGLGAFAAVIGLLRRRRTGEGARIETALTSATALEQLTWLVATQVRRPDDFDDRGPLGVPLQRIYRAQDDWICLGAAPEQAAAVIGALDARADAPLAEAIGTAIAGLTASAAIERILRAGAGAHRIESVHSLLMRPDGWARRRGALLTDLTDEHGAVTMPGPVIGLSATPMVPGDLPAPWGADSAEIAQPAPGEGARAVSRSRSRSRETGT
jgi:crotonobetainyl-CoA:carnitine CoA-transferase CaiB-like acyl-CoA transferase